MHEVLVNRLGGLSLPRKSVVRLTDRPDMTLDVYRGRKTTKQQYSFVYVSVCLSTSSYIVYLCVRPSVRLLSVRPPVWVYKKQIVCFSIGLYVFFSFVGPFDRPPIHPSCRRSVS